MDRGTTNDGSNAKLPPQRPGDGRWQSLDEMGQRCGERCSAELDYAWGEVRFVYRVEQAAFLLEFLADHLEGSDTDALARGRRMLDLAREQLDQEIAEADSRVDSGWEEGSNAAAFDKFHQASGDFLTQVVPFSRMLAAADDCLMRAARERRIQLGAFQLLVRSVVGLAKRAIADADAARILLSASLR
jgi:hypothetical protein